MRANIDIDKQFSNPFFIATVEDNNDPTFNYRVKVRIDNLHTNIETKNLPWAARVDTAFMGMSDTADLDHKIPEVGTELPQTKNYVINKYGFKKVAGISTCVELKMVERSGYVNIEVGKGSWLYKGVLLFVGIFITAGGLAVLGGIGAYNQKQLIDKVFTKR